MKKKLISFALSLAMVLFSVPAMSATAFADDSTSSTSVSTETVDLPLTTSILQEELDVIEALENSATEYDGQTIQRRARLFVANAFNDAGETEENSEFIETIQNAYNAFDGDEMTAEDYLNILYEGVTYLENLDPSNPPSDDDDEIADAAKTHRDNARSMINSLYDAIDEANENGEQFTDTESFTEALGIIRDELEAAEMQNVPDFIDEVLDDIDNIDTRLYRQIVETIQVALEAEVDEPGSSNPQMPTLDDEDDDSDVVINTDTQTAIDALFDTIYESEDWTYDIEKFNEELANIRDLMKTEGIETVPDFIDEAIASIESNDVDYLSSVLTVIKNAYRDEYTSPGSSNPKMPSSETNIGDSDKIALDGIKLADDEDSYTYTGKAITPEVVIYDEDGIEVDPENYEVSYKNNTNVGIATIIVNGINRYSGEVTAMFSIEKASIDKATVDATVTYDGTFKTPEVTVYDKNGNKVDKSGYNVSYENNFDVGTATATIEGTDNYDGVTRVDFEIEAGTIDKVTVDTESYTYDGTAKTPSVTVYDKAGNKINASNYTVSYSDNTEVGEATVTVEAKEGGNYTGKLSAKFNIEKAEEPAPSTQVAIEKATLSITSYTYDGKAKTPSVTVYDNEGNKVADSNYSVTYENNKNVGTATVTITGTGDFAGKTITESFTINPVKTSITKLSKAKKSFTVKWSKKKTQVTGYQIQYSTSSKFTSAKTKTVNSYKTTSKKIKSLKAKKKYYVKVRTYKTVNGNKYYSGWSSVKSVKTK